MSISTKDIARRLSMAVDTLRALPPDLDAAALEERTDWPLFILEARTAYLAQQVAPRVMPTGAEVQAMAEAIYWLDDLDERAAMIVWLRADGQRWRTITERTGCLRHMAWQRWQSALTLMAQRARADLAALDHSDGGSGDDDELNNQ